MEKISALIDKLQELKNSNAGLQSISYYVQLLQAEITQTRNRQKQEGHRESSHIAVIMPSATLTESANGYPNNYNYTEKVPAKAVAVAKIPEFEPPVRVAEPQQLVVEQKPEPKPVYQPVIPSTATQVPPEHQAYQPKPVVPQPVAEQKPEYQAYQPQQAPEPVAKAVQVPDYQPAKASEPVAYHPIAEQKAAPVEPKPVAEQIPHRPSAIPPPPPAPIPEVPEEKKPAMITLYSQTEQNNRPENNNGLHKELKELNQRVAQNTTSLNERFRQSQVELADRLGEMPIKDLRHAIGINDKFQFIQELFRGDIDTYERSIKTINEFHSLQEAEYWIERELKIRQGWVDQNHIVKQFYSIVRKRFT
ncbi:hypothetical protein GO495_08015 [Chitinophaga oryziterrae]|uniref:Uncharacterized protein n=1 Tax=Chitinophaga oryziterrae TaxID=1031224 RepID=A0A6N8J5I4_9BACT|nr:hypothetical protein [Chitinophaga oryziterrae]MVT40525.1 hypothetical protein [Chitinophaga oryziterrae]